MEVREASRQNLSLRGYLLALIEAYAKSGENAKLSDLLKDEVAQIGIEVPRDSPQRANAFSVLGMTLLHLNRWTDAEPLLRESLAIRQKTQPDVWSTFNTQSMLGGVLLGLKQYAQAEPLIVAGYEGMKAREDKIPANGRPRFAEGSERRQALRGMGQAGEGRRMAGQAGETHGPAQAATVKGSFRLANAVSFIGN